MAKTQAGKTYALIQNNRCHWIFTAAELPEYNEQHIHAVDVTGNVPSVGDDWNGAIFIPHVKTPEELAAEAKASERAAEKAEKDVVKALPRIQAFLAKSRDDIKTEINSANLAQLKDVIEDLAIVVHILTKQEFK